MKLMTCYVQLYIIRISRHIHLFHISHPTLSSFS